MRKFKLYSFAIVCLCFAAISTSTNIYSGTSVTQKSVEQAHKEVFQNEEITENELDFMKNLFFGQ